MRFYSYKKKFLFLELVNKKTLPVFLSLHAYMQYIDRCTAYKFLLTLFFSSFRKANLTASERKQKFSTLILLFKHRVYNCEPTKDKPIMKVFWECRVLIVNHNMISISFKRKLISNENMVPVSICIQRHIHYREVLQHRNVNVYMTTMTHGVIYGFLYLFIWVFLM